MTPIKIPGKNKRDQRRSVIEANRNKRPQPPGRPPNTSVSKTSMGSTTISVESHASADRRSLQKMKSRRKMANLEKLPTEILISIFLFSMNVNLPNASPIIAGKLSNRFTILEAITNAFNHTWEYYFELVKNHREPQAQVPGDPELQSAILRCRCATLSTLWQAEAAWLQQTVLGRGAESSAFSGTYARNRLCETDNRQDEGNLSKSSIDEIMPDNSFTTLSMCKWHYKAIDDCFGADWASFERTCDDKPAKVERASNPDLRLSWTWTGFLHVHPQIDIPESLLQGPWTTDMVKYLFWLIRAGARIRWKDSTNGEAALLGLKNAISSGNTQILYIFEYLGLAPYVTQQIMEWATDCAGGDKVEIIIMLMRMVFSANKARGGSRALAHIEMAGIIGRMRASAQPHRQQVDEGQSRDETLAMVTRLEAFLDFVNSHKRSGDRVRLKH